MQRVIHDTASADENGAGKAGFADRVPGVSPATVVPKKWLNEIQEEIVLAIEAGGLTPTTGAGQLRQLLNRVLGMYFNAKATDYGAVGDGVTNDTAAIAAVVAACNAAGGGEVVFPKGTYLTTAVITVPSIVNISGANAGSTKLLINHASNPLLLISGANTARSYIRDISLGANQANSSDLIQSGATSGRVFERCSIGDSNCEGSLADLAGSPGNEFDVAFTHCLFTCSPDAPAGLVAGQAFYDRCEFILPVGYEPTAHIVQGDGSEFHGCYFNLTALTTGTFSVLDWASTTLAGRVVNCTFTATGGATVTAVDLGAYVSGDFFESGNVFGSGIRAYNYTVPANTTGTAEVVLKTRETRILQYLTAGNATLETDQYGIIVAECSASADVTLTPAQVPEGARGSVVVKNISVDTSTHNYTPAAPFALMGAKSIGSNAVNCLEYLGTCVDGTLALVSHWMS